ncbi:hypothetical protein HMPREF1587_00394 [Bifidobacterium breve JCP7499]|nr:hypothetical protein HMPREF1587_00394 [Bifidobacterium breve JCP7499]
MGSWLPSLRRAVERSETEGSQSPKPANTAPAMSRYNKGFD